MSDPIVSVDEETLVHGKVFYRSRGKDFSLGTVSGFP